MTKRKEIDRGVAPASPSTPDKGAPPKRSKVATVDTFYCFPDAKCVLGPEEKERMQSEDEGWLGCDIAGCGRFFHTACVDVAYEGEFVCDFCAASDPRAVLQQAAKKFKSHLPLRVLMAFAQTTAGWKPWRTGDGEMLTGFPRSSTESMNWFSLSEFLKTSLNFELRKKKKKGGELSTEDKRIQGNAIKRKWKKIAEEVGLPRSGHGEEEEQALLMEVQGLPENEALAETAAFFFMQGYREYVRDTQSTEERREAEKQGVALVKAALS